MIYLFRTKKEVMTMSILSLFEGKGPKEVGELMLSDVSEFVRLKVNKALDSLLEGEI